MMKTQFLIGVKMMRDVFLAFTTVCFATITATDVRAQTDVVNHAIIVGVSGYNAKIMRPLKAPKNDVRLIWDTLHRRGVKRDNIQVLADKMADGDTVPADRKTPTRQNIISAFEALTKKISKQKEKQHFVVVYFSGHGSQQPQFGFSDDVEPDNFDEVFLPIDVGPIDMATRKIKNGLVDDEIRGLLKNLRAAGNVFVWAVFDACHSGDMTRGIEDDVQTKYIQPLDLVAPAFREQWRRDIAEAIERVATKTESQSQTKYDGWLGEGRDQSNGITVFAAAQADKLALELRIPEAQNEIFSVFTYQLVKALNRGPNLSYRSLAQQIESLYAAFQPGLPTPVYEGELDRSINLTHQDLQTWRWPAEIDKQDNQITSQLGTLSSVSVGSVLALYKVGSGEKPVGYLKVTTSGLNRSTAVPHSFRDVPEPDLAELTGPLTVAVATRNVSFSLRIAAQVNGSDQAGKTANVAIKLVQAQTGQKEGLKLDWVAVGEPADLHLRVQSDRLLILPNTGSRDHINTATQFSIPLNENSETVAKQLRENIWRLTRQKNLLRIADAIVPAKKDMPIDLRMFRIPAAKPEGATDDGYACPPPNMRELNEGGDLLDPSKPPKLKHCDVLRIEVANTGEKRVQVTGLLVGSDASISVFDVGNRPVIKPDDLLAASSLIQIVTWCAPKDCKTLGLPDGVQSTGRERLLLVVFELAEGATPLNLNYLAQPSLSKATSAKHTAFRRETSELEKMLRQATLLPETRSVAIGTIGDAAIKILQWDTER
ncbi:MAG: caspase family protein [Hyphomicrobiaceae bacterium]